MDTVRAVERALEILECFTGERKNIGLSEISRSLTLPKATVLRLIRTMEAQGYIYQHEQDLTYSLGSKVLPLAKAFLRDLNFTELALPYMQSLRDKTEESVSIYILMDLKRRLCVQRVNTHHTLRQAISVGDILPSEKGSGGKLLLTYKGYYGENYFLSKREAEQILRDGYAISIDERGEGLISISAPLYDNSNTVVASLTLSAPQVRVKASDIKNMTKEVMLASEEISRRMGYIKSN